MSDKDSSVLNNSHLNHVTASPLHPEHLVGRLIDKRFRILRFVRKDNHADIYLVDYPENDFLILEAKVYARHGQGRSLWRSQKRHFKRVLSKASTVIRQDARLFMVLNPTLLASDYMHTEDSAQVLLQNSTYGSEPVGKADAELLRGFLQPGQREWVNVFESVKLVIATTNIVVLGEEPESVSANATISTTSIRLENGLREARLSLYNILEEFQNTSLRSNLQLERLRVWDSTDAKYRNLLHQSGAIQSYKHEVLRLLKESGSDSVLRDLEQRRLINWQSFITSLALGPSHLTTPALISVLEPSQQLKDTSTVPDGGRNTWHDTGYDMVSRPLGKTEKQRRKRQAQRRRGKHREQTTWQPSSSM